MIRKSQSEDMASILALWMKSTIYAHPFIEERYWHESEAIVRDVYLPAAQTWVWEENGQLKASSAYWKPVLSGRCLSPRRVKTRHWQSASEYVQQRFPLLSLEVYQKNQSAVNFYHALGFRIEDSAWQEDTAHPTDYELAGGSNAVSGSARPVYFSNQTSAVLPAQPFPSRELGRSFVRTFTAPFLHMPPAVGSGSGHAPS